MKKEFKLPTLTISLKKERVYSDGSLPIVISIHFNKVKRRIQIKKSVHPDQFDQENPDQRKRRCKPGAPNRDEINLKLDQYQDSFKVFTDDLQASARKNRRTEVETSAREVELYLLELHQEEKLKKKAGPRIKMSFFDFCDTEVERLRKAKDHGLQFRYASAAKKFREFLGKDIALPAITTRIIDNYYRYLIDELGNRDNTAYVSVRILKTIYLRAMKVYPTLADPFKDSVKRDRGSSLPVERLNISDIRAIAALQLPAGSVISRSRDMFLMALYCAGSRVGDMILLKWSSIDARKTMITFNMQKTGDEVKVRVIPPMKAILDKYRGKSETYVFGAIPVDLKDSELLALKVKSTTALHNRMLKKIGKLAQVSIGAENMHSHLARHSFAEMLYKEDPDPRRLQAILRHKDIRTTELYMKRAGLDAIHDQMEDFWQKLLG